jgi:hypothetical protein
LVAVWKVDGTVVNQVKMATGPVDVVLDSASGLIVVSANSVRVGQIDIPKDG